MSSREMLAALLEKADIRIGGDRPWDITVHNDALYQHVFQSGTLGAGEAYMDGWWDCDALDVMFYKAISARLEESFEHTIPARLLTLYQSIFNMQDMRHSHDVADTHYNFDNAMFAQMLGPSMNYSCGYWRNAKNLAEAEEAKMDLICRKLDLGPGMTVLDIGCGWGSLARYMAEKYQARPTGVSLAEEQIAYAREHDRSGSVQWVLSDYRLVAGQFDRIVSVGMFEHVGCKNYASFMETAHRLLKPEGLFLLHTIGANHQKKAADPWINKYIFPHGVLPSGESMFRAFSDLFIMEDWQNFGADYDTTLMAWEHNFSRGLAEGKFMVSDRIRRMFRYYLLSCAGAFRARDLQLWQLVLSPRGVPGGYHSVR